MGFSLQLDFLRAILFRIHKMSKKRRSEENPGCVGRIRSSSVPALSSLKGVAGSRRVKPFKEVGESTMEGRENGNDEESSKSGRRKKKRKKKVKRGYGEEEARDGEVIVSVEEVLSREEAYREFTETNQDYSDTLVLDEIRAEEYAELEEEGHVCLDYSGYGLFSHLQHDLDSSSSSFGLSYVSGCLASHARYGDPDPGTIEFDIRRRIMRFFNVLDQGYSMVFTSSRGSAFKLLAESFPFHSSSRLLSMYDYHSQAVSWMEEIALKHGAHVSNASFKWPSLSVCASDLKAQIVHKKRRSGDGCKRLFVFPVQSRVTGSKYSYQWVSLAQENDWHVLLDASALGPKDMDSFGLSLFRPDFIITSFYKVFGSDPTGFGCLFIKHSSINTLQQSSAARGVGMVRLVPSPAISSPISVPDDAPVDGDQRSLEIEEVREKRTLRERTSRRWKHIELEEPAFSAPMACVSKTKSPYLPLHHGDNKQDANPQKNRVQQDASPQKDRVQPPVIIGSAVRRPVTCKENSVCDLASIREHSTCEKKRNSPKDSQPKNDVAISVIGNAEEGIQRLSISGGECKEVAASSSALEQTLHKSYSQRGPQIGSSSSEEGKHAQGRRTLFKSPTTEEQRLTTGYEGQSYDDNSEMSFELVDRNSECRKGKERMDCFDPGEAAGKEREPGLTSASLHSMNLASQKKSCLAYHSHEIRRDASSFVGSGGLVSHDTRRDCSLVHSEGSSYDGGSQGDLEFASSLYQEDGESSEFEVADDAWIVRREPEILCRGLNHADTLDLKKINDRLKLLMSWLISSLLKLQHRLPNKFSPLVHIYGPQENDDRGAFLAFNLFNRDGILIRPSLVQRLADRNNISLGTGLLYHIQFSANCSDLQGHLQPELDNTAGIFSNKGGSAREVGKSPMLAVVTIALGLISNFDDVYRLWAFVIKFLDAEFVSSELCCYQSLNQEQVVVGL